MAHFAFVNNSGVVENVIVIDNELLLDENGIEQEYIGISLLTKPGLYSPENGRWIQCSYNHRFRGIHASPGFSYNEEEDIFVTPQPHPSWIRNGSSWDPPSPHPTEAAPGWPEGKAWGWEWDENNLEWVAVPPPTFGEE